MSIVGKWKLVSISGDWSFIPAKCPYNELTVKAMMPNNTVEEEFDFKDWGINIRAYINGDLTNDVVAPVGKEVNHNLIDMQTVNISLGKRPLIAYVN